jgi:hypothetical protein
MSCAIPFPKKKKGPVRPLPGSGHRCQRLEVHYLRDSHVGLEFVATWVHVSLHSPLANSQHPAMTARSHVVILEVFRNGSGSRS